MPSTRNTAGEIDVARESEGTFTVRSTSGTVLSLNVSAAAQVHRYLSPIKGCVCSCPREDGVLVNQMEVVERDGELAWVTRTNIPGCHVFEIEHNTIAVRDNDNATLTLDMSAARKLHFLLRPRSCQCGCVLDGTGNASKRASFEQPEVPIPVLKATADTLPRYRGNAGEVVYSAPDVETTLAVVAHLQQEGRYQFFRGQENSDWLPYPSLARVPEHRQDEVKTRLYQFMGYARDVSRVTGVSYSTDDLWAIAQHYGLPTNFLDLTTDPVVAAMFACPPDRASGIGNATILLYSQQMIDYWSEATEYSDRTSGVELLRIDVSNLWRLQAQRGLFLFNPFELL